MKTSIVQCEKLTGRICSEGALVGYLSKPVGYDKYEGSYEVTPDSEQQTMTTKNKLMTNDVTIQPIPYYEVENSQGGTTIIIGG
jgi:hypothetical protein